MPEDKQVGWLKGRHVYCLVCTIAESGPKKVAIYHSNIYPYKQSCKHCGVVLVKPQTTAWPELFS